MHRFCIWNKVSELRERMIRYGKRISLLALNPRVIRGDDNVQRTAFSFSTIVPTDCILVSIAVKLCFTPRLRIDDANFQ